MRRDSKNSAQIKICAFLFIISLGGPLFAQNQPTQGAFVSELHGEVRGNLIRLSWIDAPNSRGTVSIFRSRIPFGETLNSGTLELIKKIPYGVQSHIDEIEEPGTYYYFAAAGNEETGRHYMVLNGSGNNIAVIAEATFDFPAGTAGTSLRITGPGPGGISTETRGDSVILRFVRSRADDRVILYRSTNPIKSAADLYNAVIVRPGIVSPYTDYPVPGISYYYAIVNEEDLVKGTFNIVPGNNATVTAVEVSGSRSGFAPQSSYPELRVIPLPQVTMTGTGLGAFGGSRGSASPRELGPEASEALENIPRIQRSVPARIEKEAEIFSEDLEVSAEGEPYLLSQIARGSFYNKRWTDCREELNRFLSLPRSEDASARARFYLGQAYYFSGIYREALFEFLRARAIYPDECLEWIHACLPLLRE